MIGFQDVIRAAGLEPPEVIVPGRLHRFPGRGKRPTNRAGWCLLFEDGRGGVFGDWSSGFSQTWQAKRDQALSPAERAAFDHAVAAAKARARAEQSARHQAAARRALAIWGRARPAPPDHLYLCRKGIAPHGARLHRGRLVLPVQDFEGRLVSLQFIAPDGTKRLLSGGRKRGAFISVTGEMECPGRVIVAEGWATACTLAEDDPEALVLAAIDAGNLKPVALGARQRWPEASLIIAGDDDRLTPGNPGCIQAMEAAQAAGALLAMPEWPEGAPEHLTDFNDLAVWLRGGAS